MDRNTVIGLLLIFGLFYLWAQMNAPTEEELAAEQRKQDSIAALEEKAYADTVQKEEAVMDTSARQSVAADTMARQAQLKPTMNLKDTSYLLENDKIRLTFSNIGGQIREVWIKDFERVYLDEEGNEQKAPLYLMNDKENKFEYIIPKSGGGYISTGNLAFSVKSQTDNSITFSAPLPEGGQVEQVYTFSDQSYVVDYDVNFKGLDNYIQPQKEIQLTWLNHLNKLEKNASYEKSYSTIYYKLTDDSPTYSSWTGDDEEELETSVRWVSHVNQFFNSTLIAEDAFSKGVLITRSMPEGAENLKQVRSTMALAVENPVQQNMNFTFFLGPNDFEKLKDVGYDLQDIIPYGWSIFGTINRWVIRPIFKFFSSFIGSLGASILILTLVVKLALYPLTFRMLNSQAKMAALKPEIAKIKDKTKDDNSAQQMETMKLYREYGVNPLGGCMPMVLQMPIWFALYRFFPASIEFRQESFLWANDLSSYDVFAQLPFYIPFYGDHVSLFTLLWAVSLFAYTYYNMNNMDTSMMQSNPMMKYMQFLMPVMFLFFLNSYASGLTCYLLFSNLFNITQTVVTKNVILDEEKIKEKLRKNKEKPKKKSGFQARLQKAMEEQRKMQKKRNKKK
jgi:YidC/Oxa1 family membrane protein insertase